MKITTVNHKIQKYIIDLLIRQQSARFSELRPPRVDTNLCTYHLRRLIALGMVQKHGNVYALGPQGLAYAAQAKHGQEVAGPSVAIAFVIQNSEGDILLERRTRQPYIDTWALPGAGMVVSDASALDSARRALVDKFESPVDEHQPYHAGTAYIHVRRGDVPIESMLLHVFRLYTDEISTTDDLVWARPHRLADYALSPATEDIMTRTFFKDPFFFEEYDIDWYSNAHEF